MIPIYAGLARKEGHLYNPQTGELISDTLKRKLEEEKEEYPNAYRFFGCGGIAELVLVADESLVLKPLEIRMSLARRSIIVVASEFFDIDQRIEDIAETMLRDALL